MRHTHLLLLIGISIFSCLVVSPAQAASGFVKLRCPESPINVSLYSVAIKRAVKEGIDPSVYNKVKVRVRLRQVSAGSQELNTESVGTILSGLDLAQTGLVTSLGGTVSFQSSCSYQFVARIRVSATDIASGTRLTASNESPFVISSPVEQHRKRS